MLAARTEWSPLNPELLNNIMQNPQHNYVAGLPVIYLFHIYLDMSMAESYKQKQTDCHRVNKMISLCMFN